MKPGALVTVAGSGAKNLYHFLFTSRTCKVNGAHPLPGANKIDFAGFAGAAGYAGTRARATLKCFDAELPEVLQNSGPQFTALEIVPGASYPRDYAYIHSAKARQTR